VIVGAAVCPGAPFLIPGTADTIADRLTVVVSACATAIAELPDADRLVLLSASSQQPRAESPGRFIEPGTVISSTALRRSDLPDHRLVTLPAGAAGRERAAGPGRPVSYSVGTVVGANLLTDRPAPFPPTIGIEIAGDPAAVAALLEEELSGAGRVCLLVIADGSACHGDDAPGRRDDRAESFDADLAAALGAGDPVALAAAAGRREVAGELLATVDPLAVLAALTVGDPPSSAALLYSDAPFGVGYLVASWRWNRT